MLRRLNRVLDFAEQTIALMDEDGFKNPDDPANNTRSEKVIAETAFLLLAVHKISETYKELKDRIAVIALQLIPLARSEKVLVEICLQPALAMEYAHAHICLTKIGLPDEKFDKILNASLQSSASDGRERLPYRMLEQEWIKKQWTNGNDEPDILRKIIGSTALNQTIDFLHGTRDDIYAFTHALIYVSDFNRSSWLLPGGRTRILEEAEIMLARCLDEQDYDLAGEVLLAWPLIGKTWSAVATFAFAVLASVEDIAGFLPTQATRIDTYRQQEGINQKKYLHGTAYHTVYVMGLLCSASLRVGKAPFKNIPASGIRKGSAAKLFYFFEHDDTFIPHWVHNFKALDEEQQDALSGLLLNMLLIRNVHRQQYDKVFQLLNLGYVMGIANTILAVQTAELLDRLSSLSEKK